MSKVYLVIWVLVIFLGLIMLIAPQGFISTLVIGIGVVSIVIGFQNLLYVRKLIDDGPFKRAIIIRGVLGIAVGLTAVIIPRFFADALWTIVMYVIAAGLLVSGLLELYEIWKLKKAGLSYSMYFYEVVVSLILAVVLFAIPATIGVTLVRILGALVTLGGIGGIIWAIKMIKNEADM